MFKQRLSSCPQIFNRQGSPGGKIDRELNERSPKPPTTTAGELAQSHCTSLRFPHILPIVEGGATRGEGRANNVDEHGNAGKSVSLWGLSV